MRRLKPPRSRGRAHLTLLAAVSLAVAGSSAAQAQPAARECILQYETSTGNTRTSANRLPSGQYNFFQGGGVTYHCEGQDNTLLADSAEYYGDQRVLYLIGNVVYTEPRARVNSERMTYFQEEDRIRAEGSVTVRTGSGTTVRGPLIDYYRVTTARPLARTVATGRPRMAVVQASQTAPAPDTVDVVANTIIAEGDNLVYASGKVEITRPDLLARGDSAFLDGSRDFARLMLSPSVESREGRKFTLTGGLIDVYSRNRVIERVVATPAGHVLSEDMELVADSVDLRIRDNELQRVIAWGSSSRARALSPDREITADSIDAIMPGQRLREVRAFGDAYANSAPDTARIVSTERDWMRGDTLMAEFDSITPGDTASRPQPRRIVATGNARSFYQLASGSAERGLPNLNYVRGRVITVHFEDRAVRQVDVTDQASGVYLEPTVATDGAARSPAGQQSPPPATPRPSGGPTGPRR